MFLFFTVINRAARSVFCPFLRFSLENSAVGAAGPQGHHWRDSQKSFLRSVPSACRVREPHGVSFIIQGCLPVPLKSQMLHAASPDKPQGQSRAALESEHAGLCAHELWVQHAPLCLLDCPLASLPDQQSPQLVALHMTGLIQGWHLSQGALVASHHV